VRLKHSLHTEDVIEKEAQRRKEEAENDKMPTSELKNKMLKLAQAYRADQIRNKEFENEIRLSYKDIELLPLL
jgi:hypothetical protein